MQVSWLTIMLSCIIPIAVTFGFVVFAKQLSLDSLISLYSSKRSRFLRRRFGRIVVDAVRGNIKRLVSKSTLLIIVLVPYAFSLLALSMLAVVEGTMDRLEQTVAELKTHEPAAEEPKGQSLDESLAKLEQGRILSIVFRSFSVLFFVIFFIAVWSLFRRSVTLVVEQNLDRLMLRLQSIANKDELITIVRLEAEVINTKTALAFVVNLIAVAENHKIGGTFLSRLQRYAKLLDED